MKKLQTLNILFFLFILFVFSTRACDHDKLDYTIHKIPHPDPNGGRILATADRESIRIATFFCKFFTPKPRLTRIYSLR